MAAVPTYRMRFSSVTANNTVCIEVLDPPTQCMPSSFPHGKLSLQYPPCKAPIRISWCSFGCPGGTVSSCGLIIKMIIPLLFLNQPSTKIPKPGILFRAVAADVLVSHIAKASHYNSESSSFQEMLDLIRTSTLPFNVCFLHKKWNVEFAKKKGNCIHILRREQGKTREESSMRLL